MKRMLLIVDPQVDFINGTLPVPDAEEAMNRLAEYIAESDGKYLHKVVTADRHPYGHCSFKENGGVWPMHCVHDTVGAAVWQPLFKPLYTTAGDVTFLYKGEHTETEEYSIFKNPKAAAEIAALIRNKGIEAIDVCGLAGDICVFDTITDGIALFGKEMFNVLPKFSPSLDGGTKLSEFCPSFDGGTKLSQMLS